MSQTNAKASESAAASITNFYGIKHADKPAWRYIALSGTMLLMIAGVNYAISFIG